MAVPTLTRSIGKLEEELGGQLFRRERHLTHLTDLGRLMQTHLPAAQRATHKAKIEAELYQQAKTTLRMGVIATMAASHLVAFLRRLNSEYPSLNLDIWESHCADIGQALDNGEIDIAIMSKPDYEDHFRPRVLYTEAYLMAFPSGHRFEQMNGVRQRYATEREDWVQSMVAAGLGLTLMPQYLPILGGISTRPLVDPEVTRTISIVTRVGRKHSEPVALALDCAASMDWEAIPGVGVPVVS